MGAGGREGGTVGFLVVGKLVGEDEGTGVGAVGEVVGLWVGS